MNDDTDECLKAWAKVLHPDLLRSNLIAASLYLTAWETLRDCVIGQLRSFYNIGLSDKGDTVGPEYASRVLARNMSPLLASLLWFQEEGVIDETDLELVDLLRAHRNEIAHHLPEFIGKQGRDIDVVLLGRLLDLVAKIDRWWIRQIEIPTNPDFDGQDVDSIPDDQIQSGRMIFLGMLIRVSTGDRDDAVKSFDQILAAVNERRSSQTRVPGAMHSSPA